MQCEESVESDDSERSRGTWWAPEARAHASGDARAHDKCALKGTGTCLPLRALHLLSAQLCMTATVLKYMTYSHVLRALFFPLLALPQLTFSFESPIILFN